MRIVSSTIRTSITPFQLSLLMMNRHGDPEAEGAWKELTTTHAKWVNSPFGTSALADVAAEGNHPLGRTVWLAIRGNRLHEELLVRIAGGLGVDFATSSEAGDDLLARGPRIKSLALLAIAAARQGMAERALAALIRRDALSTKARSLLFRARYALHGHGIEVGTNLRAPLDVADLTRLSAPALKSLLRREPDETLTMDDLNDVGLLVIGLLSDSPVALAELLKSSRTSAEQYSFVRPLTFIV